MPLTDNEILAFPDINLNDQVKTIAKKFDAACLGIYIIEMMDNAKGKVSNCPDINALMTSLTPCLQEKTLVADDWKLLHEFFKREIKRNADSAYPSRVKDVRDKNQDKKSGNWDILARNFVPSQIASALTNVGNGVFSTTFHRLGLDQSTENINKLKLKLAKNETQKDGGASKKPKTIHQRTTQKHTTKQGKVYTVYVKAGKKYIKKKSKKTNKFIYVQVG